MNATQIASYAAALSELIAAGAEVATVIEAGITAIVNEIKGGPMTDAQLDTIVATVQADATIRAQIAASDVGGD